MTNDFFLTLSVVLSFTSYIIVIKQYIVLSNWLLSFTSILLSFLYIFRDLMAHFFLLLLWNNTLLWRRKRQPNPVLLPGEVHGQRSLAGHNPRGPKELDTTEQLSLTHSTLCCMDIAQFFIHSARERHFDCSQFLAIINKSPYKYLYVDFKVNVHCNWIC